MHLALLSLLLLLACCLLLSGFAVPGVVVCGLGGAWAAVMIGEDG